ncbi:MAG: 2-oxoacid:acceptor oxidoreductase family protein [Acidobacteriales bacterium]|nr:2-oxoacid:acceptor oxidoreductase family protein [Candidatus Koribacter versatilis]MBI3645820.1 2-oxoacid:acceptor oxidoreductase family protein [Terriglobales bacterium]
MPTDTKVDVKESDILAAGYQVSHSKSPVFYDKYERKDELQHQTHYCPGCGHGIAHKLIAEALGDLGLQDKTIFVSPVGCSVFAYYYFDVGNVQMAHGRAPAGATGIKRACPDKIVISYQGDGDLAAIGTAEIIHAANRGEKITVFFVNNAIYGMTGGQMAPTTLVGQKSTTSPFGRRSSNEGFPLHMAELISTLEAPVYVERVALSDNKNVMKARKAVRRALEIQRDGIGFSFVEILSPCPTIWAKDPIEARKWVAETMVPNFPLNVFKDKKHEPVENAVVPQRPVPEVLEIAARESTPIAELPKHVHHFKEFEIKIAGFGGQGVLLLGQLLTEMGMREGLEVSWLPSYGPEMRSGSAHCHVCLSKDRIGSPLISHPDVLVALNEVSLRKFASQVAPGGLVLYNRDRLPADFPLPQARIICLPASEIADKLGSTKAANIVMLGALLEETECLLAATAEGVLKTKIKRVAMMEVNRKALAAGREFIDNYVRVGAVSQPDGFAY